MPSLRLNTLRGGPLRRRITDRRLHYDEDNKPYYVEEFEYANTESPTPGPYETRPSQIPGPTPPPPDYPGLTYAEIRELDQQERREKADRERRAQPGYETPPLLPPPIRSPRVFDFNHQMTKAEAQWLLAAAASPRFARVPYGERLEHVVGDSTLDAMHHNRARYNVLNELAITYRMPVTIEQPSESPSNQSGSSAERPSTQPAQDQDVEMEDEEEFYGHTPPPTDHLDTYYQPPRVEDRLGINDRPAAPLSRLPRPPQPLPPSVRDQSYIGISTYESSPLDRESTAQSYATARQTQQDRGHRASTGFENSPILQGFGDYNEDSPSRQPSYQPRHNAFGHILPDEDDEPQFRSDRSTFGQPRYRRSPSYDDRPPHIYDDRPIRRPEWAPRSNYTDRASSAIYESRENRTPPAPAAPPAPHPAGSMLPPPIPTPKNKGGRPKGSKDKTPRKGHPSPRKGMGEISGQPHPPPNTISQADYDKLSSSSRDSIHRAARMNHHNVGVDDECLEKCLRCHQNNSECWMGGFDKDRHRVLTGTKCRRCTEKHVECIWRDSSKPPVLLKNHHGPGGPPPPQPPPGGYGGGYDGSYGGGGNSGGGNSGGGVQT